MAPSTGKSVAMVGSGPTSLSAAGDLIQKGHRVRVFEALHELGGVLVYGIPEFRLPKDIVRLEIDNLARMGVEFETNVVVGKSVTIDELMNEEDYDAVLVASGAAGKLAMVGPCGLDDPEWNGLANRISKLAQKGTPVIWIQSPPRKSGKIQPSFYAVPKNQTVVIVVQPELTADLPNSPQSQLNLIYFCKLASTRRRRLCPICHPNHESPTNYET